MPERRSPGFGFVIACWVLVSLKGTLQESIPWLLGAGSTSRPSGMCLEAGSDYENHNVTAAFGSSVIKKDAATHRQFQSSVTVAGPDSWKEDDQYTYKTKRSSTTLFLSGQAVPQWRR